MGVNRVSHQGVEDVKNIIKKLKKLKSLRIDFPESYFGDGGAFSLSESLSELGKLEHLDINLGFNDVKDAGGLEFTKKLS